MPSQVLHDCSGILKKYGLTIAFAESATAGRMASEFSLTKDPGKILLGGLVCYDACIKENILGIAPDFVEKYSPESAEVTKEMAVRLHEFIKSDISVAVTGLTTSGGSETPEKPVGTMFIHLLIQGNSIARSEVFEGSAEDIILKAVDLAAQIILNEVKNMNL